MLTVNYVKYNGLAAFGLRERRAIFLLPLETLEVLEIGDLLWMVGEISPPVAGF